MLQSLKNPSAVCSEFLSPASTKFATFRPKRIEIKINTIVENIAALPINCLVN